MDNQQQGQHVKADVADLFVAMVQSMYAAADADNSAAAQHLQHVYQPDGFGSTLLHLRQQHLR